MAVAPSICLEALRPGVFNDAVRQGASVLVNLTDDGWFLPGWEPWQHLNGVRLRAVETRRWLVRASNSGISAFVSPEGEVVSSLAVGTRGILRGVVMPGDRLTWYVCLGNWPLWLSAAHIAARVLSAAVSRPSPHAGRSARRLY